MEPGLQGPMLGELNASVEASLCDPITSWRFDAD